MTTIPPPPPSSLAQPDPLSTILRIAERGIVVSDFATMKLRSVAPQAPSSEVRQELRALDYDVAPLADERPWRYVTRTDLDVSDAPVADKAKPIRAPEMVHESLGLIHAIDALSHSPYLFVLARTDVAGIVTRSDIQRTAVTMSALSLTLAVEQGITDLVRTLAQPTWRDHLTESRREKVESVFKDRRRHNAEIDIVECLMLSDLFDVARREPAIFKLFDFTSTEMRGLKEAIVKARNSMAHGGSLLDAFPDPVEAIAIFQEIKEFAELVRTTTSATRLVEDGALQG